MTDIDDELPFHGNCLEEWHRAPYRLIGPDRLVLINWLKTTDGGRFWDGGIRIWFEQEEDKILFQLTWC